MQKFTQTKKPISEYNKTIQISKQKYDDIIQEPDDSVEYGDQKFADMVYVVNGIKMDASDIQLGSVEIKDGETDTRTSVVPLPNKNGQCIVILDKDGDQIEDIETIASYDTELTETLDAVSTSKSTSIFTASCKVRIVSYYSDNWIKIHDGSKSAIMGEGMLLLAGSETYLILRDGYTTISTIGGKINVTLVN